MAESPEIEGAISEMTLSQKRKKWASESETSLSGESETDTGKLSPDCKRMHAERGGSPVPSYLSMKSNTSMLHPIDLRGESSNSSRMHAERGGSPVPSYLSMKSNTSMLHPIDLRGESSNSSRDQWSAESRCVPDQYTDLTLTKKSLQQTLEKLEKDEVKRFKSYLSQDYPECFEGHLEDHEVLDLVEKMQETLGRERSLKITLHILRNINQKDIADSLERDDQKNESIIKDRQKLKNNLKNKSECIFEGLAKQGLPTLLNEIYTELYITEGGNVEVNSEHEVRQIEAAYKRHTTEQTPIICNDIFKPLSGQNKPIRSVLTKGIAGIGKTVSVQKFILDWAEGKANQDIHFIFPLPFRDLNLKKEREFSLMQLLQNYFPELREIKSVEHEGVKVVFIFDGLDECRLPLDFHSKEILCDVTQSASVDVLLMNLIKGNLLPSALIWITSRPAAVEQIPPEYIHQVTEVRGFNDPQKEEYFRKRFKDQNLASRVISHMKSSRSLYIMCHIPVFCWISAAVLETKLAEADSGKIPKTLTEMYTHFLLIQTNVKNQKYHGTSETSPKKMSGSDIELILRLGKLAFHHLEKGNLIFYKEDLREYGIDVSEASVYSGVCTQIFKEECGLYQEKVYCFVHLSIQEYLAALFAFYSCVNENRNVLRPGESRLQDDRIELFELHRCTVDQALKSNNGHLDLFLQFLLGLSVDSNPSLLAGLLMHTGNGYHVPDPLTLTGSRSQSIEETVLYIKKKIRQESSAERTINLFHCLHELSDSSLVEEIQTCLKSGTLSDKKLEPDQCSALAFVLLMSEEALDVFDLKVHNTSTAGQERLVPVVRYCRRAILDNCDLTEKSCDTVALALQSVPSHLRELDLSNNNLGDSGVERLCAGLMSQHCKLQKLGLSGCQITEKGCASLASALYSNQSHLTELDLSYNRPKDLGVRALSAGLEDPSCNLKTLLIGWCNLTDGCCNDLASVLCSSHSKLRSLELRGNNLQDLGVGALSAGLEDPNCKLQRLGLGWCNLTGGCCGYLASVLHSPHSELRDLELMGNNLQDSGVRVLSSGLKHPQSQLQSLGLGWCNLTEGCCDDLSSVLRLPYSQLRYLELKDNSLQDSGVTVLSAGLKDPNCKLQRLGLSGCQVTEKGCVSLASALHANPSYLKELDLSYNLPGDSGVRALSAGLEDPKCALNTLLVDHGEESRNKPGPRKYACQLTLDPSTANRHLSLPEGDRKVTWGREEQPYLDHPERFDTLPQILCREGLCKRCYWEAEWNGEYGVDIGMTYKGINRRGGDGDAELGGNNKSWILYYTNGHYAVCHNKKRSSVPASLSPPISCSSLHRVGVYLDWPAGTLSFYSISSDTLTLLHTFHTTFTEPLYAGFRVWRGSFLSLC